MNKNEIQALLWWFSFVLSGDRSLRGRERKGGWMRVEVGKESGEARARERQPRSGHSHVYEASKSRTRTHAHRRTESEARPLGLKNSHVTHTHYVIYYTVMHGMARHTCIMQHFSILGLLAFFFYGQLIVLRTLD